MKITMFLGVVLVLVAAIGLAACDGGAEAALEDTTWVLESYGEQASPQAVLEETEITALFNSEESKVSGSAGCNNYFAGYEIDKNELSVSQVGSAMMYCEGFMDQEQEYLSLLGDAGTFQVDGGKLVIFSAGNKVLNFNAR